MFSQKLTQRFTDAIQRKTTGHAAREIVHDLRNCMGVMLLTVGSLEADPNNARDSRTIETLEKMIHKMDSRIDELAKLASEQGHPKKTGASRTRIYRLLKLPVRIR
jgi:hypothetical protein